MDKNAAAKSSFQKRMGPAPFASFEDLSDEVRARLESPSDEKGSTSSIIRLPGIMEQDPTTPVDSKSKSHLMGISLIGSASRKAYSTSQNTSSSHSPILNKIKTPRIDISRASSSSHHDSRDSTPDHEICDSIEENNVKLGLGFKEDGALELRLSTEELDFHDASETKKYHRTGAQSPSPEPEDMYLTNRKDSQSSDVILLSISGRTSRLSSIGSAGSARSRHSNASHFSITSGQSAYSRCSSPHKTMLETSFCGPKVADSHVVATQDDSKEDLDLGEFEKTLLSRKSNLTDSALVEDINRPTSSGSKPIRHEQHAKVVVSNNDISNKPIDEKPLERRSPLPKKIIASSGVEYIYIPLKGPLPVDDSEENCIKKSSSSTSHCSKTRSSASQGQNHTTKKSSTSNDTKDLIRPNSSPISSTSHHHRGNQEPKYIRIKLKPDHCYDDNDPSEPSSSNIKPTTLNLSLKAESPLSPNNIVELEHQITAMVEKTRSLTNTPSVSPKFTRRFSKEGSTPSPSVPRRNSLAAMFKSGSESPCSSKSKRKNTITSIIKTTSSCAGKGADKNKTMLFPATSSTESVDSKGKSTSVLSIFKSGSTKDKHKSKEKQPAPQEPIITKSKEVDSFRSQKKVGHSRETPLSSESIRIPLHSPTYYTKEILSPVGKEDPPTPVIAVSSHSEEYTVASLEPSKTNKELDNNVHDTKIIQSDSLNLELLEDRELQSNTLTKVELEKVPSEILKADFNKEICLEHKESPNVSRSVLSSETPSTASRDSTKTSSSADLTTKIETHVKSNNGIDDEHNSSESERDLELEYFKSNNKPRVDFLEIEKESIVLRTDSFEDELPYVPTTLPQERSAAIPILPIKQRGVLDVKTFPIERPRSTTPIYSSGLENYLDGFVTTSSSHQSKVTTVASEKLKISLPKGDTSTKPKGEVTAVTTEVKEEVKEDTPPPLPPKGIQKTWINFDEVPEKRKPPKRIQTIPSRGHIDISGLVLKENIVYTYVNPDECKCECHEHKEPESGAKTSSQDGECPLVDVENKATCSNR